MKQREFKEKMPVTAEFVEACIEVMGKEYVHRQIRAALNGEPSGFYATEGGHTIGRRDTQAIAAIHYDAKGISYSVELEWLAEARLSAQKRGIVIRPANKDDWRDVEREANELRKIIGMPTLHGKNKGDGND